MPLFCCFSKEKDVRKEEKKELNEKTVPQESPSSARSHTSDPGTTKMDESETKLDKSHIDQSPPATPKPHKKTKQSDPAVPKLAIDAPPLDSPKKKSARSNGPSSPSSPKAVSLDPVSAKAHSPENSHRSPGPKLSARERLASFVGEKDVKKVTEDVQKKVEDKKQTLLQKRITLQADFAETLKVVKQQEENDQEADLNDLDELDLDADLADLATFRPEDFDAEALEAHLLEQSIIAQLEQGIQTAIPTLDLIGDLDDESYDIGDLDDLVGELDKFQNFDLDFAASEESAQSTPEPNELEGTEGTEETEETNAHSESEADKGSSQDASVPEVASPEQTQFMLDEMEQKQKPGVHQYKSIASRLALLGDKSDDEDDHPKDSVEPAESKNKNNSDKSTPTSPRKSKAPEEVVGSPRDKKEKDKQVRQDEKAKEKNEKKMEARTKSLSKIVEKRRKETARASDSEESAPEIVKEGEIEQIIVAVHQEIAKEADSKPAPKESDNDSSDSTDDSEVEEKTQKSKIAEPIKDQGRKRILQKTLSTNSARLSLESDMSVILGGMISAERARHLVGRVQDSLKKLIIASQGLIALPNSLPIKQSDLDLQVSHVLLALKSLKHSGAIASRITTLEGKPLGVFQRELARAIRSVFEAISKLSNSVKQFQDPSKDAENLEAAQRTLAECSRAVIASLQKFDFTEGEFVVVA